MGLSTWLGVIRYETKSIIHKEKKNRLISLLQNLKPRLCERLLRGWRRKRQTKDWEKIFKNTYLTKNSYLEYIFKTFQNSS